MGCDASMSRIICVWRNYLTRRSHFMIFALAQHMFVFAKQLDWGISISLILFLPLTSGCHVSATRPAYMHGVLHALCREFACFHVDGQTLLNMEHPDTSC